MPTILVVDDEPGICRAFEQAFAQAHRVVSVPSAEAALARMDELKPDLVILDVGLPKASGLDLLPRLKGLPVIVITAQGTMATAVEAVKRGAWEYVLKPVDLDVMQIHVDRALERVRLSEEVARLKGGDPGGLIGNAPAMQEAYKRIGAAARAPVSVLLTGESGTGKELAARAIHAHSDRSGKPYVAVNCAALPETLLQSELFGHERGAFTGAVARRQGRFESADGGTLFLDEVGEMSPAVQASLLRVLETQSFERVGGTESVRVDVRIVAATNRDLRLLIGEGRFREDLFYRLHVVEIALPPLRDRLEDLPLLAAHFLHASGKALSREALEALRERPWPGNVRQLRNALEHAAALAPGPVLMPEHLPPAASPDPRAGGFSAWLDERIASAPPEAVYESLLEALERPLLERVMRLEKGNQVQAAKRLGIHRTTLRGKLQKYGMLGSEA